MIDEEGQVSVATVMSVTLSVDHRVIDGALGAELLQAIVDNLENPWVCWHKLKNGPLGPFFIGLCNDPSKPTVSRSQCSNNLRGHLRGFQQGRHATQPTLRRCGYIRQS